MFKRTQLIAAAVLFAVPAVLFFYGLLTAVPPDKIAKGVTIHGVEVGGMTAGEAEAALSARFQSAAKAKTITLGRDMFTFADFGLR